MANSRFYFAGEQRIKNRQVYASVLSQRTFVPTSLSAGTQTALTHRSIHRSHASERISSLQALYVNWYVNSSAFTEPDGSNDITVASAFDIANTVYDARKDGVAQVTIKPGGQVLFDPVPLALAAGTQFATRSYVTCGSSQFWPASNNPNSLSAIGEGGTANQDLTQPGDAACGSLNNFRSFWPVAILARTAEAQPCVAVWGDSIAAGTGDGGSNPDGDADGNCGPFARWLAPIGFLNLGIGSWQAQYSATLAKRRRRMGIARACNVTHMIIQEGTNDLRTGGRTDAQLRADRVEMGYAALAEGFRPYITTITPNSSGTFTSVAGQTKHASDPIRQAHNAWCRGVPAPFAGCIDIAAMVEVDGAGSGIWRPGFTTDGIHPSAVAAASMANDMPALDIFRL